MSTGSSAFARPADSLDDALRDLLLAGSDELGVPLSEAQVDDFALYLTELERWRKKINLTAITDSREVILKHFLDSLTLAPHIKMGAFVMDVGSGAGFPGMPLKIARPDLRVLLLDSTSKKVAFMNEVIRQLELKNVRAVQQRAEDKAFQDIMKNRVDVVVSRAAGALESFLTAAAPYVAAAGQVILMQGPSADEHIVSDARLAKLRLATPRSHMLTLPENAGDRHIMVFGKR